MERSKIEFFWDFFKTIAPEIINNPEDLKLITRLDEEVNKLGEVSWEYGPNQDDGFYFSLSPNFRFDLIPYTDFIISLSPVIPEWKFISGKPQKLENIEEFTFVNDDGSETLVNTKNWHAIAYKFKDDTYDIDFILDTNLDTETSYLALNTAMINLLGEVNYLRKVNEIKIVKKFDTNKGNGIQFNDLVNVIV